MNKTPGQVAYEAYGQHRRWRTVSGLPMPTWDQQAEDLCDAWEQAATAVGLKTPLATPGEVAAYLNKTDDALRIWRQRGLGPRWLKVGRRVRYRWEDVERWLDA